MWPFKRKKKTAYRVWEHKFWGDAINLDGHYNAHGHVPFRIEPGDEFHVKMESGGIGRYRVMSIEYCENPSDMFFAKLKPLGYFSNHQQWNHNI